MHATTDFANSRSDRLVRFPTVNAWIRAASQCGINLPPLLAKAGLCLDQHGHHLIRRDGVIELMLYCVEHAAPQRHFPLLVADCFTFDAMPVLETFIATSPTLRASLQAVEWASKLMTDLEFHVQEDKSGQMAIIVDVPGLRRPFPKAAEHFVEFVVACLCRFPRDVLGGRSMVNAVEFAHDPGPAKALCEAHFGVPVRISQPRHRVLLDRTMLDVALPGGHDELHQQMRVALAQHIAWVNQGSLASRISVLFQQQPKLTGQGIAKVAQALNLHPRTLQRRLSEEGHSFAVIVDRCRREYACKRLLDRLVTVETVSAELAFNDRNNFSRSFKRWTGTTPSAWRKSVAGATGPAGAGAAGPSTGPTEAGSSSPTEHEQ